ncbi:MAG: FHA domain-containing protein [Acidobacteria bacterium]|nr:FHA domain-containing protein [Acidobacteriota bacterium]
MAWILGGAGGLVLGLVLILRRPHRRRGLAPQTLPLLPPTTGRVPSAETHLLEAWFPGGRVLHFVLGPEQDLGRAKGSAIRLDDPSVSARHASLRELPEGFLLEDLGSTNGTWVGGIRLNAPCLLRGEESWSVGDVGLAFRPKKL